MSNARICPQRAVAYEATPHKSLDYRAFKQSFRYRKNKFSRYTWKKSITTNIFSLNLDDIYKKEAGIILSLSKLDIYHIAQKVPSFLQWLFVSEMTCTVLHRPMK